MTAAIDVRQTIDRPVDEGWAGLIDWDNAHRWMPGIDELHADGPTEVGTTLSFHARGKDLLSEIVALDPGRRVMLRSAQGGVTADHEYSVEVVSEGATDVRLVAECTTAGVVWELAGPLVRVVMRRTDSRQLGDLATYVTSDPDPDSESGS